MDRRNGGGQLAPPRPPKLLPRVHRPRAPSPPTMNEFPSTMSTNQQNPTTISETNSTNSTTVTTSTTPQCTNNNINKNQGNLINNFNEQQITKNSPQQHHHHHQQQQKPQQQQQQQQQLNSIITSNNAKVPTKSITPNTATTTTLLTTGSGPSAANNLAPTWSSPPNSPLLQQSTTNRSIASTVIRPTTPNYSTPISASTALTSNTGSPYNAFIIDISLADAYDDYQIHHLTYLPQRPSNLSRNTSNVSTTSSASSTTAVNSFTRRRPPAPPANSGATVPLLSVNNSSSNSNTNSLLSSGLFSNFHNSDTAATAPLVTLAQPRPESERLTNEYVETPLRSTQQLLHVTRSVHPAGQNDNGQTTTHHPLLLPQREFRQQQQQQLQHSNRLAGTAGSVNAIIGTTPISDELIHSRPHPLFNIQLQQPLQQQQTQQQHQHQLQQQQHHQQQQQPNIQNISFNEHNVSSTTPSSKIDLLPFPADGGEKITPPPRSRNDLQPIEQPITKQPALTNNAAALNNCDFVKCGHAFGELLDLHPLSVNQGAVSTLNGTNTIGSPILVGSNALLPNGTTMDLSSITCPRCHRCRCEQCKSPRPLPQTWLFNKSCLCSFETVTDFVSCNCFAKACFYHCCRDAECYDEGDPSTDNPCACYPYKRLKRFTLLGVLTTILPCLCLYWPLRSCGYLCAKCYARCASRGCRCSPSTTCILPAGSMGMNGNLVNNNGAINNENGSLNNSGKGHQTLSTECMANRKQIKDDKAPEKRLLDSSVEY